ncbi:MAG TPA: hypothetical protein VMB80_04510 [Candidatus Acidoferrum sp.]|nr:hypothetical protein [Candidatus Acidoferrum sp.]
MKSIFCIFASAPLLICQCAFAQNLLLNGDFSAGNSGFSTDYFFISSSQSQTPDTFGIRTNSQDFNPAYTLFVDHTTGAGLMALFDGYPTSDKVAWSETVNISPGMDYLFSGWAASADPFNPATLRFLINGSPSSADLSLPASAGVWTNFAVAWNSGTNLTATLAIVDLSTVSYGNDFALDDLAFVSLQPVLAIRQTGAKAFELSWKTQTNINYQLQWTSPLNSSNDWQNLGAPVPGNGSTNYMTDVPSAQTTKFYRLEVLF